MDYAIRVEKLGKLYTINRTAAATTLREQMASAIARMRGRPPTVPPLASEQTQHAGQSKEHWALRDISFDVMAGERVGIIGQNGAGKSTLLKILSRVTAPTEGRVEIRGKVASLLEVGTGFHPELSGRENIFLNGAILGMSHQEIRRKFDQIVDFSGVERFLDTPVKHYSSGMYVRLAFSVSAWLDPDILILDEVLAVGDQAFQRKCAERMKELTREGRTVLFVSHSMGTIRQMCQKVLYLEHGRVVTFGPVEDGAEEYERDSDEVAGIVAVPPRARSLQNPADRGGIGAVRIEELLIEGQHAAFPTIQEGGSLSLTVELSAKSEPAEIAPLDVAVGIDTASGSRVYTAVSGWEGQAFDLAAGSAQIDIQITDLRLRPGEYLLSLALICNGVTLDSIVHCGGFSVAGQREISGIPWRQEYGAARFPVSFTRRTNPL
jgi:ABC-type polysaccharide/polyol phosphate transport system ATPase subunit